jgi:hypothetical protein
MDEKRYPPRPPCARRTGKVVITDGPFAKTEGLFLVHETVECKDLNEATAVAKRFAGPLDGVRPMVFGNKSDKTGRDALLFRGNVINSHFHGLIQLFRR